MPGNSVDETFAGRPPYQRAAFDAMLAHLATLGDDVHLDAVRVGVFLKRDRKLAEVRPKARSLNLALYLERRLEDRRVAQHYDLSATRTVNVVKLCSAADVDAAVRDWLTEAYLCAGGDWGLEPGE
jgi:hypothetical protein